MTGSAAAIAPSLPAPIGLVPRKVLAPEGSA
jgi:hypothetical protein